MTDQEKTRHELTEEIARLKERISELERQSADEKRTGLALRMSEEQLRALNDNLSVGIVLIDRDMKVLMVNKKMREMFPEADYSVHPCCYQAFTPLREKSRVRAARWLKLSKALAACMLPKGLLFHPTG